MKYNLKLLKLNNRMEDTNVKSKISKQKLIQNDGIKAILVILLIASGLFYGKFG